MWRHPFPRSKAASHVLIAQCSTLRFQRACVAYRPSHPLLCHSNSTPVAHSTPNSSLINKIDKEKQIYRESLRTLLEDRRACYKDSYVLEHLGAARSGLQASVRAMWSGLGAPGLKERVGEVRLGDKQESLTGEMIESLKKQYLTTAESKKTETDRIRRLIEFYTTLLYSDVMQSETDIRTTLDHMRTVDLIEPTSAVYEAILSSLYFLAQEGGEPTIGIVGEERVLHRAQIGDAAGYYFGAALSQHRANQAVAAGEADMRPVTASLWTTFFVVAATCQVAPKLMDLWFDEFLQFFDEEKQLQSRTVKKEPPPLEEPEVGDMDVSLHQQDLLGKEAQEAEMEMSAPAALPYDAVHAILSWSAASRDIQRALRFFKEFNTRGLFLSGEGPSLPPGSLTAKSNDKQVQLLQLRLLVKLMSTGKSVKMDGGLKALITNDVKRLIDLSVIQAASWGTVNDLLSGLSMPSAMKLLKLCSSSRPEGDGSVPFAMWASLLRRCAHEHHLDQAESLFEFIRRRFQLTSLQKRELVEIAIRMYVTLPTPDFASAMHIFTEHVVHTPEGEPPVKADTTLYTLLIKAADSPNAAMMVFLEGCAEGVELQYETFEALLGAERDVSRLSRKLPHDYTSSALDSLLSIPSDVDAHQRREEALRLRNKPLFNSTGDSS